MAKTISFNGKRFSWDGKYYAPVGGYKQEHKRFHQEVWQYYNGEIPKGYHIHHKDGDRANNEINNLEAVKIKEHLSRHYKENWKDKDFREKVRKNCNNIRPLTKEWHSSEEGRKWHSEQAKTAWQKRKTVIKECEVCKKEFEAYRASIARFCHPNCKAKALRKRRRLQLNNK